MTAPAATSSRRIVLKGRRSDRGESAEPAYTLHIASGPLDSALQEFARQTGIQILFFSYLTDGQWARALDGTYTVDAAMHALLADTALTFRWVNEKTIEIRRLGTRTDRSH